MSGAPAPPASDEVVLDRSLPPYLGAKYYCTQETLKATLDEFGVAVIPGVLSPVECEAMKSGMWDFLEHATSRFPVPISRGNKATWKGMEKLYPMHSMLVQQWGIGHAQFTWDVRQHARVLESFSTIWGVPPEELLVSFDGAAIHMPPEVTKSGWYSGSFNLHTDQSYLRNGFECIQSWVTAYDVRPGDATLTALEGSHVHHGEFASRFASAASPLDWFALREPEQLDFYIKEKGCRRVCITCPAGSQVFWDSRTIHCGMEAAPQRRGANLRCVAYVCCTPRYLATKDTLAQRVQACKELRTTSHWPHRLKVFKLKPTRLPSGELVPDVPLPPAPKLTELGRRLVGY